MKYIHRELSDLIGQSEHNMVQINIAGSLSCASNLIGPLSIQVVSCYAAARKLSKSNICCYALVCFFRFSLLPCSKAARFRYCEYHPLVILGLR